MNNCRNLKQYIVDELDPINRDLFDAHLKECSGCRQAVAMDRRLAENLKDMPRVNVPHGFSLNVMAGLAAQRSSRAAWMVYAAALVVVAFATALLAGGTLGPVMEETGAVVRTMADAGSSLYTAISNISASLYQALSFGALTPVVLTGACALLAFMLVKSLLAFSVVRRR